MPLYVITPDALKPDRVYENGPAIALVTDAKLEAEIPAALRDASDRVITGDLSWLRNARIPEGYDTAILWVAGDQLLRGSGASIRCMVADAAHRTLVPVHLNGASSDELDLIGLQPRIWKRGPDAECIRQYVRVKAQATVAPQLKQLIHESPAIWARIDRALQFGRKDAEKGIDQLSRLWHESSMIPPVFGALLVRNLIVLYLRLGLPQRIDALLKAGLDRYPRCAELYFLAGWIALQQGNLKEASRYAARALENPDPSFVGSGGEGSYRSAWLAGLSAELQGKQKQTVAMYLPGLADQPAFLPSVQGLLRQHLDASTARSLGAIILPRLVHHEPQYAEAVFRFLLLHRQNEAARRILNLAQIPDNLRETLQASLDQSCMSLRPRPRLAGVKPGVILTGPFYVYSSLARINRELGAALAAATDIETALDPTGEGDVAGNELPHFEAISRGLKQQLSRLDLSIRLHWPPDFTRPPCGKLALNLPWEYTAIPCRWVEQIERNVDELWVLSRFSRDAFVEAGVSPSLIQVISPGVDTETFKPQGVSWRPDGCKRFVFLFVGGAISRKGIDILWNAYQSAFTSSDDVTLVIKEMGAGTFYQGQSLVGRIRAAAAAKPRTPHLMVLGDEFDDVKLAALYRGANALVLPYRGEGFGMPLAEALACGTPVVTTGAGPAREFCPPEASFFIPARAAELDTSQSSLGPLSSPMTWFEPDVTELAHTMRRVYERPDECTQGTASASEKIRAALRWKRITGMMLERIRHLVDL